VAWVRAGRAVSVRSVRYLHHIIAPTLHRHRLLITIRGQVINAGDAVSMANMA
jgi:hypothetical protein